MKTNTFSLLIAIALIIGLAFKSSAQRQPWDMADDLKSMVFVYHDLSNNDYKLVDIAGNPLSKSYPYMEKLRNESRIAIFKDKNNKYGVVSADGSELYPPKYDKAVIFKGNDPDSEAMIVLTAQGRAILIDQDGNKLINDKYTEIDGSYGDGTLHVAINDKKGVINAQTLKGIVVPDNYDRIEVIPNKYVIVEKKGKIGVYDLQNGELIAPFEYNTCVIPESIRYVKGNENVRNTLILTNPSGNYMLYDGKIAFVSNVGKVYALADGLAVVELDHKYIVDPDGYVFINDAGALDIVLTPAGTRQFIKTNMLTDVVKMADADGRELLPASKGFTSPEWIESLQLFKMNKGKNVAFVDVNGNVVVPPVYTLPGNITDFASDRIVLAKNGKVGVVDKANKVIVPFTYASITPEFDLNGNLKYFVASAAGRTSVLSTSGKVLVAPKAGQIIDYDPQYLTKPVPGGAFMRINAKTKTFEVYNISGKLLGTAKMSDAWFSTTGATQGYYDPYANWTPEEKANEFFSTYNKYYKAIEK